MTIEWLSLEEFKRRLEAPAPEPKPKPVVARRVDVEKGERMDPPRRLRRGPLPPPRNDFERYES